MIDGSLFFISRKMTFSPEQRRVILEAVKINRELNGRYAEKLENIVLTDMNTFYEDVGKPLSEKYKNLGSVL